MPSKVRFVSSKSMQRSFTGAVLTLLALAAAALVLPASSGAAKLNPQGIERFSHDPSGEHPYFACPPPTEERMTCNAVVVPREAKPAIRKQRKELGLTGKGLTPALEGSGVEGGFSPADLRSAYNVPEAGGKGMTIAIVDAWGYPNAESDLSTYREHYGLPPCTTANGCFRKVNQKGEEANYPPLDREPLAAWDLESALDLDMASAMCPECKLVLVESNNESYVNLGAAENKAAELGATEISNSWGGGEGATETEEDSLYYNHPGIPMFFSSGDFGYGPEYPTSSPNVISVGGTSLTKDTSARGWHERAWSGAGSGCSEYEKKPEWQTDKGCTNRTISDVSAVADPATPVAVYAKEWSESGSKAPGWVLLGGTSASAPILAGIEARASEAERAKGPRLFWEQGPEGKLFDVAEGYNGTCGKSPYLCSGKGGYDGPTGWGTPGATRPEPPAAGTYDPSNVNLTGATLSGVVNPNGGGTTFYSFEYGTTTKYGKKEAEKSVPNGTLPVAVSMSIPELTPNTTYHYRIYARTSLGKTFGADHTFVTSRWAAQEQPLETSIDRFDANSSGKGDVSCAAANDCIAVGSHLVKMTTGKYAGEYGLSPLAERWNGTEWKSLSPIVPHEIDEFVESPFYDASCTSSTFCMVLGENFDVKAGGEGALPLLERWNGSEFSLAPAAVPSDLAVDGNGFRNMHISNISCVSATYCLAIGIYQAVGFGGKRMTQVWNGSKWEIVANQKEEGAFIGPVDLSCTSATWCMAIGEQYKEGKGERLTSIWNGSKWSTQASLVGGVIRSLTCTSPSSCVAVGASRESASEEFNGVALVWNGSKWGSTSPGAGLFEDVSCLSANWCLAIGHTGGYEKNSLLVTEHQAASIWNGSSWIVEEGTPVPPQAIAGSQGPSELVAVSCKATGCTTIGDFRDPVGYAPDAIRLTLAPQNTSLPVVSPATVYEGVTEFTSDGTWAGEVENFSYQWQRCNAEGKECANIAGATFAEYTPVAADVGKTLLVKVTGNGPGGSAPGGAASSGPTVKVQGAGQVSEYVLPAGSKPIGIALGPDGKLWFTEKGTSKIGKITTSGAVTEYPLPSGSEPQAIAPGPDGKLWFTEPSKGKIGKISTSGTVTEYSVAAGTQPWGIAADPNNSQLWFTDCSGAANHSIGKITTSGVVTEYSLSGSCSSNIAAGPDGNLWFSQGGEAAKIGKITTIGTINLYSLPAKALPMGLAAGPDENIWFGNSATGASKIGKITTSGAITEYALSSGTSYPKAITSGPDGNLWFTEWGTKKIGRITTSGTISEYALPEAFKEPNYLAIGSDNRIWITSEQASRIAAMVP